MYAMAYHIRPPSQTTTTTTANTKASSLLLLFFSLILSVLYPVSSFVIQPKGSTNRSSFFIGTFGHNPRTTTSPNTKIGRRRTGSNNNDGVGVDVRMSSSSQTNTPASSETQSKQRPTTNMFENYNKPIVLIGSSSSTEGGNELVRLGNFLVNKMNGSGQVITEVNEEQEMMMSSSSDVIVLDFNTKGTEEEQSLTDLVKRLYEEHGMLCIYVNVKPKSEENTEKRETLEKDVFLKWTDYELCIQDEGHLKEEDDKEEWEHIEWELQRIIARAFLPSPIPGSTKPKTNTAHLTMGSHTFFLSLSFPQLSDVKPYVQDMCKDVDAMEVRTDLLSCRENRFDLLKSLQTLRKLCRPHAIRASAVPFKGMVMDDVMPLVYTVRTQHQAGTYPDDEEGIKSMFDLLHLGLRSGIEVMDVESAWDKTLTNKLLTKIENRYSSQILGSHHVVGNEVTTEEAVQLFQNCGLDGRAHGAKVVLTINDESKDRMAYEAASIATSLAQTNGQPVIPNIGLILNEVGQYSRILNIPFTPVTHEALPFVAAPGQLTSAEILTTRILTNILKPKKYVILGYNIAYSVSPQMHNSAFAATKLPHQYGRADMETVEEFVEGDLWNSDEFGGCSVTIPHKQSIIPYVDVMSDSAKIIGSVNTILIKEKVGEKEMERVVYGDNTDWIGIYNPLRRKLGGGSSDSNDDDDDEKDNNNKVVGCALIIGGGGTARAAAYAAVQLGLEPIYQNRTPSKALELARTFGGQVVSNLEPKEGKVHDVKQEGDDLPSLGEHLDSMNGVIQVVISTLPAAVEFVLPDWILEHNKKQLPVIFDVNYKPYNTKLLQQVTKVGCDVVRGSEMLWEQGVGQFELWTDRTGPYKIMKDVVLENCLPKEEEEGK